MIEKNDFIKLNSLYQTIKKQCIIKFFGAAGQKDADIFPRVSVFCRKLQKRGIGIFAALTQQERKFSMNEFEDDKQLPEKVYARNLVKASYSGLWTFGNTEDIDFKEDRYLFLHERVFLQDWSENTNPYAKLQKFSMDYKYEAFTFKDILFFFESISNILNEETSSYDTVSAIKDFLAEFFPKEGERILQ